MMFDETNLYVGQRVSCLAFDRVNKQAHQVIDTISFIVADGIYIGQLHVGDDRDTTVINPNLRPRFVPFEDVMEIMPDE